MNHGDLYFISNNCTLIQGDVYDEETLCNVSAIIGEARYFIISLHVEARQIKRRIKSYLT